jgi:hypothetical protein
MESSMIHSPSSTVGHSLVPNPLKFWIFVKKNSVLETNQVALENCNVLDRLEVEWPQHCCPLVT